jgi:hypothetical protein
MKSISQITRHTLLLFAGLTLGCASAPEARHTGFLSDYTNLKVIDDNKMNFVSSELASYSSFIIDPVEFSIPPEKLKEEDRDEVARHFQARLAEVLEKRELTRTDQPGPGVARLRIALTGVANSTWWKKVHPVSRIAGAGTGGAAMEGEIVDSVTGAQIGAVVQSSPGNQFDFTSFSTVADVKSAIDKWAEQAGKRLDEMQVRKG